MERPLRPAGRLPRPARRPLGRLRATHQGPYRAREGTTRAACPHVDYVLTRVKTRLRLDGRKVFQVDAATIWVQVE